MRRLFIIVAAVLLFAAAGCTGRYSIAYDEDAGEVRITYRDGTEADFAARPDADEEVPDADLIVGLGRVGGDATLGAELWAIAHEVGEGDVPAAHESALRLANWLHELERKRGRRPDRRAFGMVD